MSISTVVTRGYGTFGSVNKVPTWGYGIGSAVVTVDGITTRLTLRGTALTRLTVTGPSAERLSLRASSEP